MMDQVDSSERRSSEYTIVQGFDATSEELLDLLRGLEQTLSDKQSQKINRVILERLQWSKEGWDYLERLLQTHSIQCLEFRSTFDRVPLQTLGQARRLELHYTPLGPFISTLTPSSGHLQELVLANSTLSVMAAKLFADCLATPSFRLTVLDLSGTRFLDEAARYLARGLRDHGGSLQSLCLSECNLVDEQIWDLVAGLNACCLKDSVAFNLEQLDISFNKSRNMGTLQIAAFLRYSRLRKLSMGFQAFGESNRIDLFYFFKGIASNRILQELEVSGNSLCDADMPALVEALAGNASLKILDISENRFTNDGIAVFARKLGKMSTLEQLVMEGIREIDGSSISMLAEELVLSRNFKLHTIELDSGLGDDKDREKLFHRLDMNWSGAFTLLQDWYPEIPTAQFPLPLWAVVMERVNFPSRHGMVSRIPKAADILYYIVREGPVVLHQ